MKKIVLLLASCFLLIAAAHAQNPLVKQWDRRFGGTDTEYFDEIKQTADGGYILGGGSLSGIGGDKTQTSWGAHDYWIVKADSTGVKQWDKRFGGTDWDILYSLQQTTDGGYVLGGYSYSGISGDKTQANLGGADFWMVKTDALGNKQWDKNFGGSNDDYLFSIDQTSDGGYILGGYSLSGISGDKTQPSWGDYDCWVIKTDSLGNKQWDKDYGGTGIDRLGSIQQTSDGGYIVGGRSNSGIGGNKTQATWGAGDYWILKTDAAGTILWDKDFGGTDEDYLLSLQQTIDGGYILGGGSSSGIGGNKTQPTWGDEDYWIVKTDSLGNKQWDKDFGGTADDEFYNVSQTLDNGFLISGDSYSVISGNKTENNLGAEQIWAVKTDATGSIQWDKTIFTTGHDEEGVAIQTNDGCFVMANTTAAGIGGYKTQPSWGTTDYWLIKFCDSTLTTSTTTINHASGFNVYPNPFRDEFAVTLNYPIPQSSITLTLYDVYGREVLSQHLTTSNLKLHPSSGGTNLSKGIYLLQIQKDKERMVRKVVKQ